MSAPAHVVQIDVVCELTTVSSIGEASDVADASAEPADASFVAFAKRQFGGLTALAYGLCGDRVRSPEIAQEALLAAFQRWDEVSQLESPEGWVRRVVANQATSAIRRRIVEARALMRLRSRRDLAPMNEPGVDAEWVWAHVRDLPRRQRQVVALRFIEDLTLDEIAATLSVSKSSVSTHLQRAFYALAAHIGREDSR